MLRKSIVAVRFFCEAAAGAVPRGLSNCQSSFWACASPLESAPRGLSSRCLLCFVCVALCFSSVNRWPGVLWCVVSVRPLLVSGRPGASPAVQSLVEESASMFR